MIQLYQAMI